MGANVFMMLVVTITLDFYLIVQCITAVFV